VVNVPFVNDEETVVRVGEGLDCDRGILLVVLLEIEGELFGKLLGIDRDGYCLLRLASEVSTVSST
jgi:hypothetical protein